MWTRMHSMTLRRLNPTAVLTGAFALSTLCFLSATAATMWTQHNIGRAALDIATIASPADKQVHNIRTDVRRLDVALALEIASARGGLPDVPSPRRIDELAERIDGRLETYLASPTFPREAALQSTVRNRWAALKQELAAVRSTARRGDSHDAFVTLTSRYRTAADAFDGALVQCVELNVSEAARRGAFISAQWTRARSVGIAMTGLSVLLTLGTAFLAIRLIRRQTRLLDQRATESMEFAGRVAHDVLSPLSPIRVFLDIARKQGLEHPAVARGLPIAHAALGRLTETVDALLAFAQAGAEAPPGVACAAAEVVQGVVHDQFVDAQHHGIVIELDRIPDVQVRCAPGALASILSNLLRNSIKYMGERPVRRIRLAARLEGRVVEFEVTDTGPGVPVQWRRSVFEPLVRIRPDAAPGIGLGLATVRRLVTGHGGRVRLDAGPEGGCRVRFTLPMVTPEAQRRSAPACTPAVTG
jgi:signal transduction histidine kinase